MPTRCNRGFLLQILLLAQHVSGTTMPIIRSSRVLYSGSCLWYFVLKKCKKIILYVFVEFVFSVLSVVCYLGLLLGVSNVVGAVCGCSW